MPELVSESNEMCCLNCFTHPFLREFIRGRPAKLGNCAFCGSVRTPLVSVCSLGPLFENLLKEYIPEEHRSDEFREDGHHFVSRTLWDAIREDWNVFAHPTDLTGKLKLLLRAILRCSNLNNLHELVPESFVLDVSRFASFSAWRHWNWMTVSNKAEILDLPTAAQDLAIPGTFANAVADYIAHFVSSIEKKVVVFRARCGSVDGNGLVPFTGAEIGPNPTHPASRANQQTQVAFYAAFDEHGALAEVSANWNGPVSIARFENTRRVTIVDVGQQFAPPNPFTATNLPWLLDQEYLLTAVGSFLSSPVLNGDGEFYKPTQSFANIVRAAGYDGIRYKSAVDHGRFNIVLFDPAVVSFVESRLLHPLHDL